MITVPALSSEEATVHNAPSEGPAVHIAPSKEATNPCAPNEEVVDIDLNDPEVQKAAVFIQSGFKGFKAKKFSAAKATKVYRVVELHDAWFAVDVM